MADVAMKTSIIIEHVFRLLIQNMTRREDNNYKFTKYHDQAFIEISDSVTSNVDIQKRYFFLFYLYNQYLTLVKAYAKEDSEECT